MRALRHQPRSQSLQGLHHDVLLPVLRCRVPAGAMDGPGGRAPGALRRKALKEWCCWKKHKRFRRSAQTAAHTRRPSLYRHSVTTAPSSVTTTALEDPHKVNCHTMKLS